MQSNNYKSAVKKGGAGTLLMGCFVVILILVAGGALAAGYFGLIPGLSKILGTSKSRDLGIRYANIDRVKLFDSLGTKVIPTNQVTGTGSEMGLLLEGSKPAKFSLTSEETTAVVNSRWKYFPLSDLQIKIGQDGVVEASAILRADRIISFAKSLNFSEKDINTAIQGLKVPISNTPIYAKGTLVIEEGKSKVNFQNIEIGRASLPSSIIEKVSPQITQAVDSLINSFPGVYVKKLNFAQGKMNVEGAVPAKMTVLSDYDITL